MTPIHEPKLAESPKPLTSWLLRARVVAPVTQPVISDGAVLVRRNRIAAVGSWRALSRRAGACGRVDLGEVLLMPGLVNGHCHLDYTHMAGQLPHPRLFTDWLQAIVEVKAGWSAADYSNSWVAGAQMLLATGTTTLADTEAVPDLLPQAWDATPLRVFSFLEVIGVGRRRQPQETIAGVIHHMQRLKDGRCRAGLSPHAPYSTIPDLLRLTGAEARRHRWLLTMHVSESAAEFDMFTRGDGEMYRWIQRSGRDMSDCDRRTPVEHIDRCGLLNSNLLAIHVNYLGPQDARLLGRKGVNVVHCPRSHAYFRHAPFPYERLVKNGVNVCLGTDSLASVSKSPRLPVKLSMFDEMRAFAAAHQNVPPRQVVRMATVHGAHALRLDKRVGELTPGAFADLVAFPCTEKPSTAYDSILNFEGTISASLIDGTWVKPPSEKAQAA